MIVVMRYLEYGGRFESERSTSFEMMTIIVDLMQNSIASMGLICGQIIPELI
jgi:hypothetical protein